MKSSKNAIGSHAYLKVLLELDELQHNTFYLGEETILFLSWVLFISYNGQLGPWRNSLRISEV